MFADVVLGGVGLPLPSKRSRRGIIIAIEGCCSVDFLLLVREEGRAVSIDVESGLSHS